MYFVVAVFHPFFFCPVMQNSDCSGDDLFPRERHYLLRDYKLSPNGMHFAPRRCGSRYGTNERKCYKRLRGLVPKRSFRDVV